ncbi:NUDIX hydrolase [Flavobacterium agricola]|nr:NUDIX hydrolase [Flavobacterium agricola]
MRVSNIFLTVDIVLFKKQNTATKVLLIKRKNEPFKDCWALPGGFVDQDEDLHAAALRELEEETSIKLTALKQLGAFGTPKRDPRSHVVSVAYFAYVATDTTAVAQDDAKDVAWFDLENLPEIAFDHADILKLACSRYL